MTLTIAQAEPADAEHVGSLIASAFADLDVTAWLIPDPAGRHQPLAGQFTMLTAHAMGHGRVDLAVDDADRQLVGAAVWFDRTRPLPPVPDYDQALAELCGPHLPRFQTLDSAFEQHHPAAPHHHLAFLAARPDRRGQGIGTALLRTHHARLDADGHAAYLEAADERSRALYAAHGYQTRAPLRLPDAGPVMWPMWRPLATLSPAITTARKDTRP